MPKNRDRRVLLLVFGVLFVVLFMVGMTHQQKPLALVAPPPTLSADEKAQIGLGAGGHEGKTTATPILPPTLSADEKAVVPEPEPGSQWSYSGGEDKMGRKRSFARVTSTNTLSFDFPYQGSQNGTLTIRKSQSGTNVRIPGQAEQHSGVKPNRIPG
jgi:hypothetical protein